MLFFPRDKEKTMQQILLMLLFAIVIILCGAFLPWVKPARLALSKLGETVKHFWCCSPDWWLMDLDYLVHCELSGSAVGGVGE